MKWLKPFQKRYYSKMSETKRTVYVSQSKNVYANLALEDWFFKNWNFENHQLLLLWTTDPSVVIGTFQNPWLESNISVFESIKTKINLARRRSGGGAVFCDNGNLNLTFLTTRKDYNRRDNVEFIGNVLAKQYDLFVDILPKFDLILDEAKVSGTASKLGINNAYHHCSLLVNVNKELLEIILNKNIVNGTSLKIKTNATKSVRSRVMNLAQKNNSITIDNLIKSLAEQFLTNELNFQYINPNEESFPGIEKLKRDFSSWEWIFGRTPKFSISKPTELVGNLVLTVEKGRISNIKVENAKLENNIYANLDEFYGQKFEENALIKIEEALLRHFEIFRNF